jgi:hypothetical protein
MRVKPIRARVPRMVSYSHTNEIRPRIEIKVYPWFCDTKPLVAAILFTDE